MTTSPNQSTLPATRPVGRPAKVLSVVPKRTEAERIRMVNHYHDNHKAALLQACNYALLCGMELLAARAEIKHGEWLPWIEKNCKFSQPTAYKYMTLAEGAMPVLKAQYPELLEGAEQVAPSLMKVAERKALVEAVSQMVDGRTIQELQLELMGMTAKPTAPKGGAREGAGRPAEGANFGEVRKAAFRQDYAEIFRKLTDAIVIKKTWQYLDTKDLVEMEDRLKMYRDTIKFALQAATTR